MRSHLPTGEVFARQLDSVALIARDHTVEVLSTYGTVRLEEEPPRDRDDFLAWISARPYRLNHRNRLTTIDGD